VRWIAVTSLCLIGGWVPPTYAAPPASSTVEPKEPIDIPEVVVHSRRAAEDETIPTSVISRKDVTDAVAGLPEMLDEQPGLRTSRLGGLESYSTVSIRGSSADQVLVTLDGIPLNSAEGGGVDMSTIPFGPVERVLIYRGAAPIGFGTSSMGGVVSIETRDLAGQWLEMEAGGGSFETRLLRGFYGTGGADWGAGVALDYLGSTGNYRYLNDQGTVFSTTDDKTVTRKNNAFDQVSLLGKAFVALNEDWRLGAINWFSWRKQGVPGLALHPTEESSLERMRNLLGLRLHGKRLGNQRVALSVIPYLSWSQTVFSDPLSEVGFGADRVRDQSLVPGLIGTLGHPMPLDDDADFVLTPRLNVQYRYERFMPGTGRDTITLHASERHRLSAAAELALSTEPIATEVLGSLRYESVWNAMNNPGNRPLITEPPSADSFSDAWTLRGGLVQRSIPHTELRANASYGVRFPSLFELFGNNGYVLGNPGLKPERGVGVDFGVVHSAEWLDRPNTWSVEVFAFARWTDQLIQFVQNAQNISVAENIASARILGVEFGTYLDCFRHVRGRGSLTWMQSENRSDIVAHQGKQLPHRPQWKAFGRLEAYGRWPGVLSELGVSAELEALSGNYRDPTNLVAVPARWIVGAGLYALFQQRRIRLDVTARNLTNNRVQDYTGFPLPGLSVMTTLRYTPLVDGS